MRCIVCGSESFETFHKGTRDNPAIDVMKCTKCMSLQLSSFEQIEEGFYEDGNMHKDQYSAIQDAYSEQVWDSWIDETKEDDDRRAAMLEETWGGLDGNVLDFGCGNGGFLRRIKARSTTANAIGVELDKATRAHLVQEGIEVYESIDSIDQSMKFDIITMFHVIEHLEEPYKIIEKMKERLSDNGLLIIETPNAEDALISQYHSKSFMDFTFWSAHLFLYNTYSLGLLLDNCGFLAVNNSQIQRYPLANHLYWLSESLPGGHAKWKELNCDSLNTPYADALRKLQKCDTLLGVFKKRGLEII